MPPRDLAELEGAFPGGAWIRRVLVAGRTGSTNADARRLIEDLGPAAVQGLVLIAREQEQGRGTRGRGWWCPPGRGLPLSVILCPHPPLLRPAALTLAAALAVADAAGRLGATLALRWPNDVVDPAGGKIAGVLAEALPTAPPSFVVGIGVNVLEPGAPPAEVDQPIASVAQAGGQVATVAHFAQLLLADLDRRLIQAHGQAAQVIEAFASRDWLRGRPVRLRRGSEVQCGIFQGLDGEFCVRLDTPSGSVRWPAEQVERVRD